MITLAIGLLSLTIILGLIAVCLGLARIALALEDANHLTRQYYIQDYRGEEQE